MTKETIIEDYKRCKQPYLKFNMMGKYFYNEEFVDFLLNSIIEQDKQILKEI